MFPAALALFGAVVYGSADFLGGLAARRLRPILVTAIAAASGIVPVVAAYPLLGGGWAPADVWWGLLSGVTGALAVALLYACLAIGPMSILSPLTAVMSAIAPMIWGVAVNHESLGVLGYAGLAVALVAVVLVGVVPGSGAARPSLRGLAMAVGAGLSIGAFLIVIDQTSDASGVTPLLLNRAVNVALTGSIVAVLIVVGRRRGERARAVLGARGAAIGAAPSGHVDLEHAVHPVRSLRIGGASALALAVGCGVADAVANVLMLVAIRAGDLAIVAALTALYPAGTILLAAMVLRERVARLQAVGLMLALASGVLLALA